MSVTKALGKKIIELLRSIRTFDKRSIGPRQERQFNYKETFGGADISVFLKESVRDKSIYEALELIERSANNMNHVFLLLDAHNIPMNNELEAAITKIRKQALDDMDRFGLLTDAPATDPSLKILRNLAHKHYQKQDAEQSSVNDCKDTLANLQPFQTCTEQDALWRNQAK